MGGGRTLEVAHFGAVDQQEQVEDHIASGHPAALLAWRRFGDVVIASVMLLILAIPMLIIAVVVKVTSPGPVLFRQERIGRSGQRFTMLKFRTMRDGTDAEVAAARSQRTELDSSDFKLSSDDPRITAVGRVLRKLSIDELPQLWNVLRGEMSIVGIRPVEEGELATRSVADQAIYCAMRPGLTGLWQIAGRSAVGIDDRLALDRSYVETWSPWQDVKVLLRTPFAILRVHRTH